MILQLTKLDKMLALVADIAVFISPFSPICLNKVVVSLIGFKKSVFRLKVPNLHLIIRADT